MKKHLLLFCLALFATGIVLADSMSSTIRVLSTARHTVNTDGYDIVDPAQIEVNAAVSIDRSYHILATVASTASAVYDLNGSLTDAFGDVATFSTIKALTVRNDSLTATIAVGGGASDVTGIGRVTIPPDGCLLVTSPNGWPVTAGNDEITIAIATGSSATYRLLVTGTK